MVVVQESLANNYRFVEQQLCFRAVKPLSSCQPLIVALPGGPAISSHYLDKFLYNMWRKTDFNAGVLDLPNHGKSILNNTHLTSYEQLISLLENFFLELSSIAKDIILLGHSFGSRLGWDILANNRIAIVASAFISFPVEDKASKEFDREFNMLVPQDFQIVTNQDFAFYWKKIFPLYFYQRNLSTTYQGITEEVYWQGNEMLSSFVPDILNGSNPSCPLLFISGENDMRLSENNRIKIAELFPNSEHQILQRSGHFPMLENEEEISHNIIEFLKKNLKRTLH